MATSSSIVERFRAEQNPISPIVTFDARTGVSLTLGPRAIAVIVEHHPLDDLDREPSDTWIAPDLVWDVAARPTHWIASTRLGTTTTVLRPVKEDLTITVLRWQSGPASKAGQNHLFGLFDRLLESIMVAAAATTRPTLRIWAVCRDGKERSPATVLFLHLLLTSMRDTMRCNKAQWRTMVQEATREARMKQSLFWQTMESLVINHQPTNAYLRARDPYLEAQPIYCHYCGLAEATHAVIMTTTVIFTCSMDQ